MQANSSHSGRVGCGKGLGPGSDSGSGCGLGHPTLLPSDHSLLGPGPSPYQTGVAFHGLEGLEPARERSSVPFRVMAAKCFPPKKHKKTKTKKRNTQLLEQRILLESTPNFYWVFDFTGT
jgi:hypothetical protein